MPESTPSLCEPVNPKLYLAICVSEALLEANMASPGQTLASLTPLVLNEIGNANNPDQLTDALFSVEIIPKTVAPASALAVVSEAWSNATVPPGTQCCWDGEEWHFYDPSQGYLKDTAPCKLEPPVTQ